MIFMFFSSKLNLRSDATSELSSEVSFHARQRASLYEFLVLASKKAWNLKTPVASTWAALHRVLPADTRPS